MVSLVPFTEILLSTFKRDASEDQDMSMVNQFILLIRGAIYVSIPTKKTGICRVDDNYKFLKCQRKYEEFKHKEKGEEILLENIPLSFTSDILLYDLKHI